MTIGVVVFPGSNCDRDVHWAIEGCLNLPTRRLWHEETDLSGLDAVVLPGGFSYGDYLRCGAIARFAPVLQSLMDFASKGGKVLGICNGFQVLTELGLLPGALTRNQNLHFICEDAPLQVSSARTGWSPGTYNRSRKTKHRSSTTRAQSVYTYCQGGALTHLLPCGRRPSRRRR